MTVTFFRGHPSNELLPRAEILKAVTTVLSQPQSTDDDEETRHPLTYGSDPGALAVRKAIVEYTNRKNPAKVPPTPDCVNLTNGASFGAASALTQCCPSNFTRLALAITPTYFLINDILTDAGFEGRMKGVVETDDGIDLAGLEEILKKDLEKCDDVLQTRDPLRFRYVLYMVPVFSNPGGYTSTDDENKRLLAIAREYNMLLLCDHVYDYLNYGDNSSVYRPLVALDRETLPACSLGNVIANCSFSKYLGPGLRVGWQECATPKLAHHLSQTGANKSGGSPAHLNSFVARELILNGGLERILSNLNATYSSRAEQYLAAMRKFLPEGTIIRGGKGGYFFWLQFPSEYDIKAITSECASQGIRLAPGEHFEVNGDQKGWGQSCFRVSLSYHGAEEAVNAIKEWGVISLKHRRPSTPSAI